MIDFLPPVLMGEARQQQQVVLCWDTRTTQPCTPLVTGVVWEGVCVCACVYGGGHEECILRTIYIAHESSSAVQHFKHSNQE